MFSIFLNFVRRVFFRTIKSPKRIILAIVVLMFLFGIGAVYSWQKDKLAFYSKHHTAMQTVQKLTNVLFFPYWFSNSQLERYDLIIDQKDWDFLNENLPPIYQGRSLSSEYRQEVKAKFMAAGKEYDVKVRYRGEMDNHWRDPQKSWLVDFGKEKFNGDKEIHLIIPVDRDYLLEEFSYYRARKAGLLVPDTKFVNFFVNGERQGVYWQMEGWSKEMLDKQKIAGETNLYSAIDREDGMLPPTDFSYFDNINLWKKYASSTKKLADDFSDLAAFFKVINNPDDNFFAEKIGQILDLNSFYQWQINQYLVNSVHQGDTGGNQRLYFDTASDKFKFIPWDVSLGTDLPPPLWEVKYSRLVTRVLANPVFLHERNKLLWAYVGQPENLADDLKHYDDLDALTKNDFYKDNKKVESDLAYRSKIKKMRNTIIEDFNYVKNNLKNAVAQVTVRTKEPNKLIVDLTSTGFSAINLDKIKITAEDCQSQIKIFHDVNKNGIYDATDKFLTSFSCADNIYEAQPNFLIYAIKDLTDPNYLKPGVKTESLIFMTEEPFNFKIMNDKNIKFTIVNAVTDELANDVLTKFIYE